jgi:hypothetical protein
VAHVYADLVTFTLFVAIAEESNLGGIRDDTLNFDAYFVLGSAFLFEYHCVEESFACRQVTATSKTKRHAS